MVRRRPAGDSTMVGVRSGHGSPSTRTSASDGSLETWRKPRAGSARSTAGGAGVPSRESASTSESVPAATTVSTTAAPIATVRKVRRRSWARSRAVAEPVARGKIVPDEHDFLPFFEKHEVGEFQFWRPLPWDEDKGLFRPLKEGRFVLGADVAAGTGGDWSSCSALSVIDCENGDQVCEFRSNSTKPDVFARIVYRVGQFFNWALVAPEITGTVGALFLDQFRELGYPGALVTDTAYLRYPWYHTEHDTPERLDYERMAELVRGLHAIVLDRDVAD